MRPMTRRDAILTLAACTAASPALAALGERPGTYSENEIVDSGRTMMLVCNLPAVEAIFRRFGGVDGSAYLVGGFGLTALKADEVVIVPIRAGVGARLGLNLGYLKFTPESTWNPF